MIRIIIFLGKVWGTLVVGPILRIIFWRRKYIPKIENPLFYTAAEDVATLIRKREVTSRYVVEMYINRIKLVNPIVNAVVDERFSKALLEADAVDQLIAETQDIESLGSAFPFLGVPFTAKENLGVEGLSQAVGVITRINMKCSSNGSAIELLKRAGAICLCVTNTPEFSMNLETYNHISGRTRNPYDTRRTPGGSTGGEASLIGSGASLFGIGSDVAGSIRLPALNVGIYGHKPTPGLVPYKNFYPIVDDPNIDKFFTIGLLTRYAKDIEPIFKIILGDNIQKLTLNKNVNLKKLKVYYAEEYDNSVLINAIDPEIKASVRKVVQYLGNKGACVLKLQDHLKNLKYVLEIGTTALTGISDPKVLEHNGKSENIKQEYAKALIGCSNHSIGMLQFEIMRRCRGFIRSSNLSKWIKMGEKMEIDLNRLLDGSSIIICPTFCKPALFHYEIAHYGCGSAYLILANTFGLPATHIPMGLHKNSKLPIGVQIIAGPKQDHICIQIAKKLELEFGGWKPPE